MTEDPTRQNTSRSRAWLLVTAFVLASCGASADAALPTATTENIIPLDSSTTSTRPSTTTTTTSTTTSTTTTSTSTTTTLPEPAVDATTWVAAGAPTEIPVYDTAWQLFALATPGETDSYFETLAEYGFSGAWAAVLHHEPATLADSYAGGGRLGEINEDGFVSLSDRYVRRVNRILDSADASGMKLGLVPAWQNLYLPGGASDGSNPSSEEVRGAITEDNAWSFGRQMALNFGDHPAVSMWVFGGDASSNNTEENKAIWRLMASGIRSTENEHRIAYHTPTVAHDQNNYVGEWWMDILAPQTGHTQNEAATAAQLGASVAASDVPVWAGEPRYFGIEFDWIPPGLRNPGVEEMRADAVAAAEAGVGGYVYGDAGRWRWCRPGGDATPCDPKDIAASFGDAERAVIDVFRAP